MNYEKKFIQYVKKNTKEFITYKKIGENGWPDFLIWFNCYDTPIKLVEVKGKKGHEKPTKGLFQKSQIRWFRKYGKTYCISYVAFFGKSKEWELYEFDGEEFKSCGIEDLWL